MSQAERPNEDATTMPAPPPVEPTSEHSWLQRLVGEWTFQPHGEPDAAPGTETIRPVGGVWVIAEGRGRMPDGTPALTMMTLGYDPEKGRFVGTWIGSMMTCLWVYEGQLDVTHDALRLEAVGPSFAGDGKMRRYRDTIEIRSDDHRVLTSHVQRDDGSWEQFMTMDYWRKA